MATKVTTPAARTIRCAPCGGSGTELGIIDGVIVARPCFWCEGRKFIDLPPDADEPAACPCCGLAGVVIEGTAVCPDCTAFEPADPEPAEVPF